PVRWSPRTCPRTPSWSGSPPGESGGSAAPVTGSSSATPTASGYAPRPARSTSRPRGPSTAADSAADDDPAHAVGIPGRGVGDPATVHQNAYARQVGRRQRGVRRVVGLDHRGYDLLAAVRGQVEDLELLGRVHR